MYEGVNELVGACEDAQLIGWESYGRGGTSNTLDRELDVTSGWEVEDEVVLMRRSGG